MLITSMEERWAARGTTDSRVDPQTDAPVHGISAVSFLSLNDVRIDELPAVFVMTGQGNMQRKVHAAPRKHIAKCRGVICVRSSLYFVGCFISNDETVVSC